MWFVVSLVYLSESAHLYCPDRGGHFAKKFTLEEATRFAAEVNRMSRGPVAGVHPATMYSGPDAEKILGGDTHYFGR